MYTHHKHTYHVHNTHRPQTQEESVHKSVLYREFLWRSYLRFIMENTWKIILRKKCRLSFEWQTGRQKLF